MRELKFGHKTAYLTEKQVAQLIAYLNPKNAVQDHGYFRIKKYSPLCRVDSPFATPDCRTCPIGEPLGGHACISIIGNFGKNYEYRALFDTYEIYWRPENDKGARNALERIRQRLRELPRT